MLDQFNNQSNPGYHYASTGPEIYSQVGEDIDAFICGMGTGELFPVSEKVPQREETDVYIAGNQGT